MHTKCEFSVQEDGVLKLTVTTVHFRSYQDFKEKGVAEVMSAFIDYMRSNPDPVLQRALDAAPAKGFDVEMMRPDGQHLPFF